MLDATIFDADKGVWLKFDEPIEVCEIGTADLLVPTLERLERECCARGMYAVGYIAYEASAVFDSSLAVHSDGSRFPLACFALFNPPDQFNALPDPARADDFPRHWEPSLSVSEYEAAIARIRDYIAAGDTYQVNFTYKLKSLLRCDPWELFCRMCNSQSGPYSAFIDSPRWAICSASPELFFSMKDGRIVSRPMKGTLARGLTCAEDRRQRERLRSSAKDRAENIMITDMVRNDIGRISASGSERVEALCAIEKYPTVWQMISSVAASTDVTVSEALRALFPAASITGAPKCRTMQIIRELESEPRRIYTGAIGYMAPDGSAQFSVAIRTALVDKRDGVVEYGVGGGIVWDSDAAREYAETESKARILFSDYPQFELLETILWTPADGFTLLERHLQRLADSAEYFGYAFNRDVIINRLKSAARGFGSSAKRLRLLIDGLGDCHIESRDFTPNAAGRCPRVALAESPIDSRDVFLYHKTTNRDVYESRLIPGYDDVILWNERDEITESTIANVIVDDGDGLKTPPVECGLLAGTFRAELIESGRVTESVITKHDLLSSQSVYLANSVRKLYGVDMIHS